MIDLSAKLAVLGVVAAALTSRATPAGAAMAHRVWCLVLISPVVLLAGSFAVPPAVLLLPDHRLLDAVADAAPGAAVVRPMLAVYITITVALLVRLTAGLLAVRGLVRASTPVPADVEAAARAVVGDGVRLRQGALRVPVTAGFLRPVILLPADWSALSGVQRAAVLRHEHAHVRRGDYAWGVYASAVAAVLWFHPAVWLAGRQARWFAELASDHAAASALGSFTYARALADLAERWCQERPARLAVTVGAHSGVVARLRLLVDEHQSPGRVAAICALGLILAVWLAGPAIAVRVVPSVVVNALPGGHDAAHQHQQHGGSHTLRH